LDEDHPYVSKWEKDLRVYVQGNATQRSRDAPHEAL
jgi:hypothetical protein